VAAMGRTNAAGARARPARMDPEPRTFWKNREAKYQLAIVVVPIRISRIVPTETELERTAPARITTRSSPQPEPAALLRIIATMILSRVSAVEHVPRVVPLAEVVRSGFVESVHLGALVGLNAAGEIALSIGDTDAVILPRSSLKPLQSLACHTAGAGLTGPHLAIAAGSHTGQDFHVAAVTEILSNAGLSPEALQCPEDWPRDEGTRLRSIQSGHAPSRIRMNCSGKHAAMLAACVASNWPIESYLDGDHPLAAHVRTTIEELADEPVGHTAVDGCGAPLYGLTLTGLARAIRALAAAAPGTPGGAVADAIRTHPEYVGGTGHVNTELMRAIPGTIAKGGAEGVLVAATMDGHTVAVKLIGGSNIPTTPVVIAALAALGVDTRAAKNLRTVAVLGGGRQVGEIRACIPTA
jgi:L-asparaginase II